MAYIDEHTGITYLYGFSRILTMIRRSFFEDNKSNHGITEEKQEVCMDRDLVCMNASNEVLGRFLMQDVRVITYISRKLRKHEEKYAMHELELLAIVYALRFLRHYLIGHKFELRIDHCGLHIYLHRVT
jgi:hypothetical protein